MEVGTSNVMLSLALVVATAAALFDLRTGHIPNALTLPGILLGGATQLALVPYHGAFAAQAGGLAALASALLRLALGMLVCGLVPYLLFRRGAMGGGDVKLLAALGALLGPVVGLEVELHAFVVMALFAPARLAYEGRLLRVLGNATTLVLNPLRPRARRRVLAPELMASLRFGPAVAVAMLLTALLHWAPA